MSEVCENAHDSATSIVIFCVQGTVNGLARNASHPGFLWERDFTGPYGQSFIDTGCKWGAYSTGTEIPRMNVALGKWMEGRLFAVLSQRETTDTPSAPCGCANMPVPRALMQASRVLTLILWLPCSLIPRLVSQADSTGDQTLDSYQGQNVSALDIAGRPDLSLSNLQPFFAQQPGTPFRKGEDQSNYCRAQIRRPLHKCAGGSVSQPEADGIHIEIVLEPAVYFGIFQFPGAERFAYSHLIQVANYPTETPYSASVVETDRALLLTFLQQSGYFQADVKTEVQIDKIHAIANVLFHVTLGRKAKFGVVDIMEHPLKIVSPFKPTSPPFWRAPALGAAIRRGKTWTTAARSTRPRSTSSRPCKKGC